MVKRPITAMTDISKFISNPISYCDVLDQEIDALEDKLVTDRFVLTSAIQIANFL